MTPSRLGLGDLSTYEPDELTQIGRELFISLPNGQARSSLMADLTKAMQSTAESAREETLGRLQTDAKAYIETVHTRSATEAEQLRQNADADIAGIREWSKAEVLLDSQTFLPQSIQTIDPAGTSRNGAWRGR